MKYSEIKKIYLIAIITLFTIIPSLSFATNDKWWDIDWNYRIKFEINTTQYNRTDWPIEILINFSKYFNGTFDINSTRLFEYYNNSIYIEIPHQFEYDENFNANGNAIGTLVFILNGTTDSYKKRIFYLYFDNIENNNITKPKVNYSNNISYYWDGKILNVNNTLLRFYIDTNRGENSSGIYYVKDKFDNVIINAQENDKTSEYVEYFNGTHNLTFDLRNKMEIFNGSIRLIAKQTGDEIVFGNINQKTNETKITKKYYIYNKIGEEKKGTFIKIYQKIENIATYQIQRNSTDAGALAFDLNRTFGSGIGIEDFLGNSMEPFSYYEAGSSGYVVGIINLNSSSNYFAKNTSERIGIHLNNTNIPSNSFIEQTALVYFAGSGGSDAVSEFLSIRDRFVNPVEILQYPTEKWYVEIIPSTNATIYNRNETVIIYANISAGDPYNLTKYVNATIDMGTTSEIDDTKIILYDDGTHGDENSDDKIFTNIFNLSDNATLGLWNINITAYNGSYVLLSYNLTLFNVTDILNVTVEILNPNGLTNRIIFANVYVKNYRKDTWIIGANVSCSYDSITVNNIIDMNNGTYYVNFTAPNNEGIYTLMCNATKSGNFGNDTDTFLTEPEKTDVKIVVDISNITIYNITLYDNNSFVLVANVSNIGNGTSYNLNITPELLFGWSANPPIEYCGNVNKTSYCIKSFTITIPNGTSPGNYSINMSVYWTNPDNTTNINKTYLNVYIEPNPKIDVYETIVSKEIGDGIESYAGNFTIFSIGNAPLQNITFNCTSGIVCQNFTVEFNPSNISNIDVNQNQSVSINVTVPLGFPAGIYNGTVNVTANKTYDTFILEIIIPSSTNLSIDAPTIITVYNITLNDNQSFSFIVNITNVGNGSARNSNITLEIPLNWSSNSSFEFCGNLTSYMKCSRSFNVTVPNTTIPAIYLLNITASWINPNNLIGSNKILINVNVSSNSVINISKNNLSATANVSEKKEIGNFTIFSIGNAPLQNITFNCTSGIVCQNFTVEFNPSNISNIDVNQNQSVSINVTVPLGFPAGIYNGTIDIYAKDSNHKNLLLEITVLPYRTWTMIPNSCSRSEYPDFGVVCIVTITNTGNIETNFTITPESVNYTWVNETNFTVNMNSNHTFSVLYNITNATQMIYNMTYIIDAIQDASPDSMMLNITLLPYTPPNVILALSPEKSEQDNEIEIFANVTDISNSGISWVKVNVTRPNGIIDANYINLINQSGNLSQWRIIYNNSWGNTSIRGIYNVTVYAQDNIGNIGNSTTNFTIYINITENLTTFSNSYLQGDTGSIYYKAKNYDVGVQNVNVTFKIKDPNNNTIYQSSFITNEDGIVYPLPAFILPSDSIIGDYTLISNSHYIDNVTNTIIEKQRNITFVVKSRTITVTGLFADIETAIVWYPENVMKFGILVYNGEGKPVDPTQMILNVYDPADNIYFSINMSDMKRNSTGYYKYSYAMPINTPSGMFLAVLNVTQNEFSTMKLKAFRVARGGPYDIRLELLENEVEQDDYLDFNIIIENKGEVSQDVFIEYWISSQNNIYYSKSEYVYTPAYSNQSFTRNAYIYSNQPLGTYTLIIKVTYDTVQQPLIVNSSFLVKAKTKFPPPPPSGAGGVGGAAPPTGLVTAIPEEKYSYILIETYNNNISLAKGTTKIENVIIRNVGQTNLENLSILITGIPLSWYKTTPENYKTVQRDNPYIFLIEFNIPNDAKEGEYKATLIANTNKASDQKPITINIFKSIEEILNIEISKLKESLQNLIIDTKVAEREGKDITSVNIILEEIKTQINLAEENLKKKKTDEALTNVGNSKNLIERAYDILSKLEVSKKPEAIIPLWLIVSIIIIIIVISSIIFLKKRKKLTSLRHPHILNLLKIVKEKELDKDYLKKEYEKFSRMLDILEKERKENIISGNAYNEMKKSIEEKLEKINKKLKYTH